MCKKQFEWKNEATKSNNSVINKTETNLQVKNLTNN